MSISRARSFSRRFRRCAAALSPLSLSLLLGVCPRIALASGISSARFGGEHGHPTTDNATAIYYNPAGMALSSGTHVFVDGTMNLRFLGYTRPAVGPNDVVSGALPVQDSQASLELAPGANDGQARLLNVVGLPFAAVTSDFGTDFITAGAAFYVPFGGNSRWSENALYANNDRFPGAVDGVQRFHTIEGTLQSMYITAGVAFNIRKIGLSLGVTASAIRSNVDTIRARNIDGTDDLVGNDGSTLKEGRSHLDVSGWQGGFSLGAIYDVLARGKVFIGVSYTSQPNVAGGMRLAGSLTNVFGRGAPSDARVELRQTLPDILRFGVRVRPSERYELRAFGDYTRWSVFEGQCVLDRAVEDRSCEIAGGDEAFADPSRYGTEGELEGVVQNIPRLWKDSGGFRLGGSYWFIPALEGYLGFGYDGTAVPLETLEASLVDMHKVTASAGFRWRIIDHIAIAFTATEVFYLRTSTKGRSVLNGFAPITRAPNANGVYRQFAQLFNLYADVSF